MRGLALRAAASRRLASVGLAALAATAAALVTTAAAVAPARAGDGGSHPLDSALEMMNLKADPGRMPDFVEQSRHDLSQESYIPAGAKPGSRDLKLKTPAEVKALTAELDAARAAQVAGKRPKSSSAGAGGPAKRPKALNMAGKADAATNH